MRPFLWKIIICLTPCVLAGWVTTVAAVRYYNGEPGGFKFGVDLVGGTILVYEIDLTKQLERDKSNPQRDTHLLAESLKRRIDPNDLFNIMIRPAGGEGRVEIILPTGGTHRAEVAEKAWKDLLDLMSKKYGVKDLEVGRGRILELANAIHTQKSEAVWSKNVFGTLEGWRTFLKNTYNSDFKFPRLKNPQENPKYIGDEKPNPLAVASSIAHMSLTTPQNPLWQAYDLCFQKEELGPKLVGANVRLLNNTWQLFALADPKTLSGGNQLKTFSDMLEGELREGTSQRTIEAWIKEQAWEQMLHKARDKWPELKITLFDPDSRADQLAKKDSALGFKAVITPDSHEELVGFIQTKGNLFGAAGLAVLEPLMGKNVLGESDEAKKKFVSYEEADKFIKDNYGPSLKAIVKEIEDEYRKGGRSKDLTVEEVQRIKELVSKVGSLEFRILANDKDDAVAMGDAKAYFADPRNAPKLKELQERGEAPPGPRDAADKPKIYKIELARGQTSKLSYSWVEMGPTQRKDLGLDNASENSPEPSRYKLWQQVKNARIQGKATQLTFPDDPSRKYLNGALVYSRECRNQNLPEEERKAKAVEYFILTRDPEIDPNDPTDTRRVPKVDGSYLVNAAPDRTGGTPAVHFVFNATGGELFGNLTRKNVPGGAGGSGDDHKRHLAIVLDGLIQSAPTINSEIRDRGQISGSFTQREVDNLVNILRAGALPASLKPQPVSESTMGSTLGNDTITKGVWAVFWAFLAVLAFMLVYYRFAGLVASIALLANLLMTVGFMVAVQATFTLPGLAGLVLMLGMAVDANVLIYERLREERERGASLALAIRNGYDRALPTIIDTHLSSIFTAIVLYVVGNDQLKGFGVSLTVGLIISLFTSLYMTRLFFDLWQSKGWLKKLSMMRLFSRPDIDFMGVRYIFFAITITVSVLGVVLFVGRGVEGVNIDFRGGTAYSGRLRNGKAQSIQDLRHMVDEGRQKEMLQVKSVKEETPGLVYKITYADGETLRVSLANKIEGVSSSNNEEIMRQRATHLPDAAVEQIFPSPAALERLGLQLPEDSSKSYFFTVRSSERETELVQAGIDRLFRDGKEPLMQKVFMRYEPVTNTGFRLRFFNVSPPADYDPVADQRKPKAERYSEEHKDYASPSFVKTLLMRELMREKGEKGLVSLVDENKAEKSSKLKFSVDVSGEGSSQDGRYSTLKVIFTPALDQIKEKGVDKDKLIKAIEDALNNASTEFSNRPQPERLENFDSALAAETRFRAMWAILASWGAILLYLWFRFGNWTFGLAAVLCLIHDLFFTLGAIAACHYVYDTWWGQGIQLEDFKIDLNAVAALLTLVGYSVNDTIVVFDRIREVRGKNPELTPQMINDSINQTLSRTILASLTTWLVVAVLFWWGGPGVHLFAFVMVVGVIVGTYSSIYIASPLLLIFGEGAPAAEHGRGRPTPSAPVQQPAPAPA